VGRDEDTAFRVRSAYVRTFEPGQTVFEQGDPGDHLYVIQSGEVELTREGPKGLRVLAHLGAGDFFGELSVVLGQVRTTRAVAVRKTRVLELDRETLEAMCLAQPEIAIRMIRLLVSRLIEAERRLAALGAEDLLGPVVRALVRGAQRDERAEGTGFRVDTTLRALAERAGLSLLEVHRALHRLFDRKLVQLVDDQLRIADLEALAACLD
jgi:CRP-like cAMP-binding protein